MLQAHNFYLNTYKYNYRNPVTAKICERVEEYPYSTLRGLLNPAEARLKLEPDLTFESDRAGTLRWLNTEPDPKKWEAVRWALKRPLFKSKNDRKYNRPILAADELL